MGADSLVASLLGRPRFSVAAAPITFPSKKALALFAYLVLNRKVHARRDLAALLWGERGGETSRGNLRLALHRLPAELTACLASDRDSVGIRTGAPLACDVERFDALAGSDDLAKLEEAATLYRDGLLKDLDADATPEFDDWLHAERVRWEQRAQSVFDRILGIRASIASRDAARAPEQREAALATALRWAGLMPGSEAAHRWLIRLHLDRGQRDAAIAQFELCQRLLAVSHGRPPAVETRELYDLAVEAKGSTRVAGRDPADQAGRVPTLDRATVEATSFVGRLEELAALNRLLDDPSARLITLHGMGGVGKTRLAHALATDAQRRFADGVVWVGLDEAQSPDALPAALAGALGRGIPPHGDRAAAVAEMLSRQERLIVLDNLETLLAFDGAAGDAEPRNVILTILDTAKRTRIVATSREVLGVREEWVYEVPGLPFDGDGAVATAPAIELFAQRARRAYLGFSLEAELPHVARICRLVEGLPLGIEIAAAWVRTIPCGEIAAAVEREAATQRGGAHRNPPGRHQSLDALIRYSWNLLSREQQDGLAGMGLFIGGFTRDAAERVADTPLRTLSALVDKAMVRRGAEGRYSLHELVRQFALARLDESGARSRSATRRHVAFYRDLLLATYDRSRGPDEVDANVAFRADMPNILASFRRGVAAESLDAVERIAAPLVSLLHTQGLLREALGVAEEAVRALEGGAREAFLGPIRLQWGRAAITGGRPETAKRELDLALRSAARDKPEVVATCLHYRAAFLYQQGEIDAAQRDIDEATRLCAGSDNSELRSMCFNVQGSLANMHARFDVAEAQLREGLAAAREQGTPSQIAVLLCGLAVPLYYQGRLSDAAALTREAAVLSEKLGKMPNAVFARNNLAAIELAMDALEPARIDAETAVRLARNGGSDSALSGCLATLGEVLLKSGRLAEARLAAEEGLEIASAVGNMLQATHALRVLVGIELGEGRRDRALVRLREMHAALARNRIEVRIPMWILAAADCALASAEPAERRQAIGWLHALARRDGVDSMLRKDARAVLLREGAAAEAMDTAPLADVEAEVAAFVVASTPRTS